jgi:hypothetical protein
MRVIVVRELGDGWQVDDQEGELLPPSSEPDAIKFALGEASRSFKEGTRAEVQFRPAGSDAPSPLVDFSDDEG